ncbi:MAG: flagellar protein FlgN [Bermanella sp.]
MLLNMSPHTVAGELTQMLSAEQATVDQLKQVLEQESRALSQHDIKAIESCASIKSKLLKTFSKQVQARLRYLATQKLAASESGLFELLGSLDKPLQASIKQQWQILKKDFNTLLQQNETNGAVIQHSRTRNRSLLNILHGNKNQPNLYNESGATQTQANSHTLGEA